MQEQPWHSMPVAKYSLRPKKNLNLYDISEYNESRHIFVLGCLFSKRREQSLKGHIGSEGETRDCNTMCPCKLYLVHNIYITLATWFIICYSKNNDHGLGDATVFTCIHGVLISSNGFFGHGFQDFDAKRFESAPNKLCLSHIQQLIHVHRRPSILGFFLWYTRKFGQPSIVLV